ncbi:hypothetical protein DSL64_26645 [Dyadobacter luteus]|uniref:DUF3324 domain-containing protein n=1 Tax=Dyadobacter luteus TaxID=2259619 RepID=A0A3D8Y3B8_9BACT|nr:hypothetical protein [Dyadobacter luteus]REA56500.1 hypothetical protein DSL64_26645 [Dyadobacter luteus]
MKLHFTQLTLSLLLSTTLHASVVIVNGLTHAHTIRSVDSKTQGVIRVKNQGAKESRILVYRQDLTSECGKSATYPETGSHSRSLGNDLKTNVDEKLLAANEEYELHYSIELDKAKAAAGSYWEVVMVEVAEPVQEQAAQGIQVNSKVRYAIQVIVDVGTYEGPALTYESVVFDKVSDKLSLLKVTLKNNGTFSARTGVILEIYDAAGNKLKATEPTNRMLYPRNCSTFEIPVTDLPKGKYDSVIIADTKKDLFGSNIALLVE